MRRRTLAVSLTRPIVDSAPEVPMLSGRVSEQREFLYDERPGVHLSTAQAVLTSES